MAFTPEEIGEIIEQFMETVGTRQYIGARYVPIFGRKGETSIEWDNTAPYEPLTIVLYQGNSYTSRQYVPAGIDITNLDFWAPTGTYNAQVAAYVAQVQQFDGRISQNTNDIEALEDAVGDLQESNVHLYAFPGDGSAIVITDGTTNILIDTAVNTAATTLKNWIQSELGISTFNVCILSHFHPDHAGGFSGLHELFDNTTQFFIQMPCTTTNGEYSIYQTWHNAMLNSIASYSFNSPIVPEQDSVYTFGDFKIQFGNTILANRSVYDNCRANNGYDNNTYSGLNNYSLISYITHGNLVILDAGDIEGEAQRLNVPYMRKATVARNPHHFANQMGYYEWYNRVSPDYWYATLVNGQSASVGGSVSPYIAYLYRYVKYGNGTNFVVYPYDRWVHFHFKNGYAVDIDGNHLNLAGGFKSSYNGGTPIYASLPASYYNVNPYILHDMTLAEWVEEMKGAENDTWVLVNSGFFGDSQIRKDLSAEMVGSASESTAASITLWGLQKNGSVITVEAYLSTQRVNMIELYLATYAGPDSMAGKKKYTNDILPVWINFTNAITGGQYYVADGGASSDDVNRLNKARIVGAVIEGTTTCIPCVRSIASLSGGSGQYRGFSMNTAGTHLYFVALNTDRFTAAKDVEIATGTVTNLMIGSLHTIN